MINYVCHGTDGMITRTWPGSIELLSTMPPYEAEVRARGSLFHILFGEHAYGNYLCIPNWNIGTELASLTDRFWNFERLTGYTTLLPVDACSIADALVELDNYIRS